MAQRIIYIHSVEIGGVRYRRCLQTYTHGTYRCSQPVTVGSHFCEDHR